MTMDYHKITIQVNLKLIIYKCKYLKIIYSLKDLIAILDIL